MLNCLQGFCDNIGLFSIFTLLSFCLSTENCGHILSVHAYLFGKEFIHSFIHSPSSGSRDIARDKDPAPVGAAGAQCPDLQFRTTLLSPQLPGVLLADDPLLSPPGNCPWLKGAVSSKVAPLCSCSLQPVTGCCGSTKSPPPLSQFRTSLKQYPRFGTPLRSVSTAAPLSAQSCRGPNPLWLLLLRANPCPPPPPLVGSLTQISISEFFPGNSSYNTRHYEVYILEEGNRK